MCIEQMNLKIMDITQANKEFSIMVVKHTIYN